MRDVIQWLASANTIKKFRGTARSWQVQQLSSPEERSVPHSVGFEDTRKVTVHVPDTEQKNNNTECDYLCLLPHENINSFVQPIKVRPSTYCDKSKSNMSVRHTCPSSHLLHRWTNLTATSYSFHIGT